MVVIASRINSGDDDVKIKEYCNVMTMSSRAAKGSKIFYGWILAAVLLLMLSISVGTSIYMYSIIAGGLEQELGASRLLLMTGSTGFILVMGLCSPTIGRLLDRYPNRLIVVAGAVIMGSGFILMALSTAAWMAIVSYIFLIAIGTATLGYLTMATLISRWFVRYRGLVIGVVSLGTQLGGFVYPSIFAAAMETYSWRIAMAGLGTFIILIVPLISWLTVVDCPEDMGQCPDGSASELTSGDLNAQAVPVPKLSLLDLLGHRNFLLLIFIVGVGTATNSVLLANLALFATDIGEPIVRGAFLISLVALLGIAFSPLIGWLCDFLNIKIMAAVVMLSFAMSCLLFSVATTYPMLALATGFAGIGGGGIFPLWASLVGHLYHSRIYGQVMGTTTFLISIITATLMLSAGWAHGYTDSYRLIFLTLFFALTVTTLAIAWIRLPAWTEEKFGAKSLARDDPSCTACGHV